MDKISITFAFIVCQCITGCGTGIKDNKINPFQYDSLHNNNTRKLTEPIYQNMVDSIRHIAILTVDSSKFLSLLYSDKNLSGKLKRNGFKIVPIVKKNNINIFHSLNKELENRIDFYVYAKNTPEDDDELGMFNVLNTTKTEIKIGNNLIDITNIRKQPTEIYEKNNNWYDHDRNEERYNFPFVMCPASLSLGEEEFFSGYSSGDLYSFQLGNCNYIFIFGAIRCTGVDCFTNETLVIQLLKDTINAFHIAENLYEPFGFNNRFFGDLNNDGYLDFFDFIVIEGRPYCFEEDEFYYKIRLLAYSIIDNKVVRCCDAKGKQYFIEYFKICNPVDPLIYISDYHWINELK